MSRRPDELWFYVPDYPAVRQRLEKAYAKLRVDEWAAEPGRVGGCPNDADVTVRGIPADLSAFRTWLETESDIRGLMIEGEDV